MWEFLAGFLFGLGLIPFFKYGLPVLMKIFREIKKKNQVPDHAEEL